MIDREGASVYEICVLKHIPGKGLRILKDGTESASEVSDWEVRLLFGLVTLEWAVDHPDEWCVVVTDDEDGAWRAVSGQKLRPSSVVSGAGLRPAVKLGWPVPGVFLKARNPLPPLIPATQRVAERILLELLAAGIAESEYLATLNKLVIFYREIGENGLAASVAQFVLESTGDTEARAAAYLHLGQLAERVGQFQLAHQCYAQGLALDAQDKIVAYLLHNNTGYCLNILGQSEEAERFCRLAIEIDPGEHNAFKNLGISLERQGDLEGAVRAYIDATKTDPQDPRALHLLEKLLADHLELRSCFAGVLKELAICVN